MTTGCGAAARFSFALLTTTALAGALFVVVGSRPLFFAQAAAATEAVATEDGDGSVRYGVDVVRSYCKY